MPLPFYFGVNEESHYHNIANMVHANCRTSGPLKVLAVGEFQGAYWHKLFPQDLLFAVDNAKPYNSHVLEPSFTTYLKMHFDAKSDTYTLGIAPCAFDVVLFNCNPLCGASIADDIMQTLAYGGVFMCISPAWTYTNWSTPIMPTEDGGMYTYNSAFNAFDWLSRYVGLRVKHLSLVPESAFTKVEGRYEQDSAPMLLIAIKEEVKNDT